MDLQRDEQSLRYLTRLERDPQYARELDVLKKHYDAIHTEGNKSPTLIGTRARTLRQGQDLQSQPVLNKIKESPPWLLRKVNICSGGAIVRKQDAPTTQLKQDFEFHLEQHSNSKHIYTRRSEV